MTPRADTRIFQNEYSIWVVQDKHSRAYNALTSPIGERIGSILGIGKSEEAPKCLACHALDVAPATIIGNSLGGRVAIEAALRRPDMVSRLVLLCPSPAFRRMRQFVPFVRLLQPGAMITPLPLPHRAVVVAIRSIFADPDRLPDAWYDSAADEHLRVMKHYRHRRAFYSTMREIYLDPAYGEDGFWDRLPLLQAPALFIWGDRDWIVPASFEQHVVRALPQAQSVVLADCGHVPQFEHPDETAELIRRFLTA